MDLKLAGTATVVPPMANSPGPRPVGAPGRVLARRELPLGQIYLLAIKSRRGHAKATVSTGHK